MLEKERHIYITSRLESKNTISVKELCEELGVSRATVRRDLQRLQADGKIDRARGGAVKAGYEEMMSDYNEAPVLEKMYVNLDQKRLIGKRAAEEIEAGDLIFIDSGTTPTQLLPFINKKKIKVVTNSVILLSQLSGFDEIETYFVGGKYNKVHEVCVGTSTVEQLNDFRFDKCFIGASGADVNIGEVYTSEFDFGAVKKCVIKRSKYSFLLVDDAKFMRTGFNKFADFRDFKRIFTNHYADGYKKHQNIEIAGNWKEAQK